MVKKKIAYELLTNASGSSRGERQQQATDSGRNCDKRECKASANNWISAAACCWEPVDSTECWRRHRPSRWLNSILSWWNLHAATVFDYYCKQLAAVAPETVDSRPSSVDRLADVGLGALHLLWSWSSVSALCLCTSVCVCGFECLCMSVYVCVRAETTAMTMKQRVALNSVDVYNKFLKVF